MTSIRRFFVDRIDNETLLEGEEFQHAKNVLRLQEGDEILLLDNSGKEYNAIVAKVDKRQILCNVMGYNEGERETKQKVRLLFGFLKGDKSELVVQKATELGVKEIATFSSEFSSAYMSDNKLERLNKVSKEASKQCLRSVAPKVEYFDNLEKALSSCQDFENKLFACEFAKESETDMSKLKGSTAVVIGSEGGFSQREAELATKYGFSLVSLGKRILRAETASITMCSIVMYELGELN